MTPSLSRMRLGLRSKLFMLIVFAFGALVLSIVWQIDQKAGDLARQTIDRSLAQSTRVLAADLNRRFGDIEEVAVSITRDGRVMPLVYERAALTLQDLAQEFERALNFDVLMFLDSEGRVLARNDRAEAVGQVLAGRSALVDAALTGQRAQGYFVSGGQLMQMLAVPVFDNVAEGLVRGAVLTAYTLSAEIASEIRELTDSEVAFAIFTYDAGRTVNGAEVIYSTDPTITSTLSAHLADEGSWRRYFNAVTPAEQLKLDLGGDTYFASLQPLANGGDPSLGFALALRSRTELLRPFHALQQRILLTAAVCLALAALLAWFLAQRVTRPIIAMAAVARDIQQGRYPDDPGPIVRRDEVGALQRAVFAMGRSLQEKAALEHYLATVTEELEPDEELLSDASLLALPVNPAAAQESDDDRQSADLEGDVPSGEPSLAGEAKFIAPIQAKSADTTQLRLEPVEHSAVKLGIPADPTLLHPSDRGSVATEVEPFDAALFDGRYELHRLLGTGGTGRVYLALDNELRERVAIKLIDRELLKKYTNFDFREEIRLARKITHRNIVRIYDFGSTDEYWYITMEYIPGLNLDTLLNRRGAQKMAIGIMLVRQICYAMQAAHEQGVIHCDLKPSNIMINRQGILKIMDFGLAVTAVAQAATSSVPSQVIGTPRYMAPEQYLGQPLDVRTDLYAIGLITYAIFVGPPYADVAAEDLALAHLKWPLPPLPAQAMQLSPGLPAIIERCTAKAPADRYPSVRALLDDLAALGPIGDANAP